MSAAEQLVLFEPAGLELAELAERHGKRSSYLEKVAETLRVRGFFVSAGFYDSQGESAKAQATVCELALMFEREPGLA